MLWLAWRALVAASLVYCSPPDGSGDMVEVVDVTWVVPQRRLGIDQQLGSEYSVDTIDVNFSAHGVDFFLHLRRNHVLLPATARHWLHFADGHVEEGPMPEACFYTGDVEGDVSGGISLATCPFGITGLICAHGHTIVIEPAAETVPSQSSQEFRRMRHAVRRVTDERFLDYQADISNFLKQEDGEDGHARRLTGAATKYVEVLVVNDHSRYVAFGGSSGLDALAKHSTDVVAGVTTLYRTPPANGGVFPYTIQVVLVAQHTFVNSDPWESSVLKVGAETDCSSLLELFNAWTQTQMSADILVTNDNRILLSGRDFDGNTVGLAGVSAMCDLSRSGNVNMCGNSADHLPSCAATVAHEIGHNFGMNHDHGGANCPQGGFIMEAVSTADNPTQFSTCSATDISNYFGKVYPGDQCLENIPTRVFGDPVCGNGFIESNEDCDCGRADCSGIDDCCDGSACKFKTHTPAYQCSDTTSLCCENCMIVAASANYVCREARNSCDLPETCQGDSPDCPRDAFVYPGASCNLTHNGNSYTGLCSAGKCMSMSHTCANDLTRDFEGSWDLTAPCASFNDDCKTAVCHNASHSDAYACAQYFSVHGKQMAVPDGTPCWLHEDPYGQRNGMCYLGSCKQAHDLAEIPLCGNGGIDYGEQCDCGKACDPCCDCSTCLLKAGRQCSSLDPCCDSNTCTFKAAGTVCRAAFGECDVAETCLGNSGMCPVDVGKTWGTACTASDGTPSTCYGKVCVISMDTHCSTVTDGVRPHADRTYDGVRRLSTYHQCKSLMCCAQFSILSGTYSIGGETHTNPHYAQDCLRLTKSSTFTVDGVSTTIWTTMVPIGTVLQDPTQICLPSEPDPFTYTPPNSCISGKYLELSVGACLTCDSACDACTGPTNFDCTGNCKFGSKDARGACAISNEQSSFASSARRRALKNVCAWPNTSVPIRRRRSRRRGIDPVILLPPVLAPVPAPNAVPGAPTTTNTTSTTTDVGAGPGGVVTSSSHRVKPRGMMRQLSMSMLLAVLVNSL